MSKQTGLSQRDRIKAKLRYQVCINCEYLVSPFFNDRLYCDCAFRSEEDDDLIVSEPYVEWCEHWEHKYL